MFQGRPKVHRDGADLDLDLRISLSLRQIDRDRHHHMVALISVRLRIFNVVLDMQDCNIRLSGDHIRDGINIGHKGTDDPDPRDVV